MELNRPPVTVHHLDGVHVADIGDDGRLPDSCCLVHPLYGLAGPVSPVEIAAM